MPALLEAREELVEESHLGGGDYEVLQNALRVVRTQLVAELELRRLEKERVLCGGGKRGAMMTLRSLWVRVRRGGVARVAGTMRSAAGGRARCSTS